MGKHRFVVLGLTCLITFFVVLHIFFQFFFCFCGVQMVYSGSFILRRAKSSKTMLSSSSLVYSEFS